MQGLRKGQSKRWCKSWRLGSVRVCVCVSQMDPSTASQLARAVEERDRLQRRFDQLKVSSARQLQELHEENMRLKQRIAELERVADAANDTDWSDEEERGSKDERKAGDGPETSRTPASASSSAPRAHEADPFLVAPGLPTEVPRTAGTVAVAAHADRNVVCIAVSPPEAPQMVASGGADRHVRLWAAAGP